MGFELCSEEVSCNINQTQICGDRPVCDLFCLWQGMYGIENEVFLSLPSVLSASGLTSVINQKLKDDEVTQLRKSAETLWNVQKDIKDL